MLRGRLLPPALSALVFTLVASAPEARANLVGRHFRVDSMYAGTTYVSTIVTVVDPGVEIACATPTSNGPGCGININQGGYSIDFSDGGIVFRTSASFGSMYGPDRNLLRFTLVDGGFMVAGASLVASDVPGLVASRVTFTSSSVTLDVSGLLAPATETTSIAVSVSPVGTQMAPNPNPLGHTIDVLAALLNASAFDNLGEILVELSGSLLNSGILTNEGTIDNFGSLINALDGTLGNVASLMNEVGSTLTNNGSLTNSGGGPAGSGDGVTNAGTVTNNGTVTNSGSFLNQFNAALNNIGNILNSGNLDNRGGWFTSGTVTSTGTVLNDVRATLENAGMIMTGAGGAINAYFDNAGALINNGTIDNWGVLRNEITGALTNSMKIVNKADAECQNLGNLMNDAINSVFENDGHVMNSGTFDVGPGGSVTGSGTYTQTGGTTVVNGSMSQTAVDIAAGVLMGAGSVSGSVTNEGGTVAPGNSPGTLTINGSYTQKAGSLKMWVAGTGSGQYSTLIVHGTADLSGGTLRLSFVNGFVPKVGDQWQVLTANSLKNFDPASCRLDGLLQGSAISCRQSGSTVVATVTAVTGSGATFTVPIVLSSGGLSGSFFTSELALTNRGTTDAAITYVYTSSFGGSNGTATDSLAAGRQKLIPDVITYLGDLGIPVGGSGNRGGTLQVNFSGLSSAEAGAASVRTTTAVAEGRAGLAYAGLDSSKLLSAPVYVCGLRQNGTDRSNVAVLNVGSPGEGEIRLRLRVVSGNPANPVSQLLPDVVLSPGGFFQESGVLASNGLSLDNGYVRVERVSGTAPFYAYGVINDQANSDGSFVEPVLSAPAAAVHGATLPVVVETGAFSTELVVTNFSAGPRTLAGTYVAAGLPGGKAMFNLALLPNEQQILPDFVQVLRSRGVIPGGPGSTLVGALFVTDSTGDLRGVSIGARTSSAGGGGRYGLFYAAVPNGSEGTASAWLYGLRQDADNRTNIALVNVGSTASADTFRIDLYDGATGQKAGSTDVTVPANGFSQINAIFATIAPNVARGYALVTRTSGTNPFIAYAVVNDGGLPGQRSGDGAFVSASVPGP